MFRYTILLFILDGILAEHTCNTGNRRGRIFLCVCLLSEDLIKGLRKMVYDQRKQLINALGTVSTCQPSCKKIWLTFDSYFFDEH